jgi:hypothetical protein
MALVVREMLFGLPAAEVAEGAAELPELVEALVEDEPATGELATVGLVATVPDWLSAAAVDPAARSTRNTQRFFTLGPNLREVKDFAILNDERKPRRRKEQEVFEL